MAIDDKWYGFVHKQIPIYPLITFRILFGLVTLISTLRFLLLGWVEEQYITPILHFTYYGLDWAKPLPGMLMYIPFTIMLLCSVNIILGAFYKISAFIFFISFTYVELIDVTYYLNHYYFVSIISFWMIFVPAHRYLSIDSVCNRKIIITYTSAWTINILKFHLCIVYFFAGIAKINTDWLLNAMPLSIWLPAKNYMPVIGFTFDYKITAYLFSWVGMLFDIFISYLLIYRHTTVWAWVVLCMFHIITGYLFQIGVFPLVMSACTLIFFDNNIHKNVINTLGKICNYHAPALTKYYAPTMGHHHKLFAYLIGIYVIFQLLLPMRYLLYPGNIFWTEEGYRFAWRVMLMEKAGTVAFYVTDSQTGKRGEVVNSDFLNAHQEKQMAFQPDMILQFAHYLHKYYRAKGVNDPLVNCHAYVTLNGRPSRLYIDTTINLAKKQDSWQPKSWILPF
ncbi:MAG: HTTM domain-containing protein [Cytophagales bacterium]|nr:HTTM domain-containing protein [Cytophagales bacterium]